MVAGRRHPTSRGVANTGFNLDLTGVTVTGAASPPDTTVVRQVPRRGAITTVDCTLTTDAGDVGTVSNVASVPVTRRPPWTQPGWT